MEAAQSGAKEVKVSLVDEDRAAEQGVVVECQGVVQERLPTRLFGAMQFVFRFMISASTDWRIIDWISCNEAETEWVIDLSGEQVGQELIQRLFDELQARG
jgi:hypothetical protein